MSTPLGSVGSGSEVQGSVDLPAGNWMMVSQILEPVPEAGPFASRPFNIEQELVKMNIEQEKFKMAPPKVLDVQPSRPQPRIIPAPTAKEETGPKAAVIPKAVETKQTPPKPKMLTKPVRKQVVASKPKVAVKKKPIKPKATIGQPPPK